MGTKVKAIREMSCNLIFLMYLLGVICIAINPNITNKMINITGALAFLLVITSGSYRSYSKSVMLLALALFLLGSLDLAWYGFYKTHDVIFKNGYRGYLEAGKMLVFSAFTFLLLSRHRFKQNINFHLLAALIAQAVMLGRAYYQGIYLHAERIPLSAMGGSIGQMGAATIAAYMITFCALYASIVFLCLQSKYKWPLFYINFALTFAAIMMTGTRAAFFTYPVMTLVLLFIQHQKQKTYLFKGMGGFAILLIGCGLLFNKDIVKRVDDLQQDVTSYANSSNSMSSVGARFSMILSGYASRPDGLQWQSLEQRAVKITALSKKDPIYQGATLFLDVHMHNELAEALSIKGVAGVLFLILFYAALIYYCLREKLYLLLVFPASLMLFGVSDVLTHAKPIPAAWITCLLLAALALGQSRQQPELR